MADMRTGFIAVILMAAIVLSSVHGRPQKSNALPDQFEFSEGHAHLGSDSVKWENGKLVFVKRVADMSGKGSFVETVEKLSPTPEERQRFWVRMDALGVWQWKSDYHDPKHNSPDGESWASTLRCGAKQVKSKGYNAVPGAYGEFREAAYKLMEDTRHDERN